ncbi:hypothetical protein F4780DRAFT_484212 [Xylariomycetidae sp. FL0641]|nr:hypothetical protein F4780DRAFT_484212 [Xylariomycetidae sp. FL0641]
MAEAPLYYQEPPPGQVRTPSNPPNKAADLMAAGIATTIIAGLSVGLRVYTRLQVVQGGLNADDWLVMAAFAVSLSMLVFVKKDIDHGLTYHVWDILMSDYHVGERLYGLLAYLTFIFSITLAKLSILVLYLRLAPHAWFRWTCYGCMAVIASYSVVAALVESLACQPLAGIVNESLKGAHCYDSYPAYIALSSLNAAMDVVILLLPVPLILRMQLPTRQKASIILLFATGILVCAVALKRVSYIPVLEASSDYDWDAVPDMILCFIEVNAGIVCASVPAVRPFFSRLLPVVLARRQHHRKTSGEDTVAVAHTDGGGGGGADRLVLTAEQRNLERRKYRTPLEEDALALSNIASAAAGRDANVYRQLHSADEEARLWGYPARQM